MTEWNATLYDRQHDFMAEYGKGLLTFVPQQPKQFWIWVAARAR